MYPGAGRGICIRGPSPPLYPPVPLPLVAGCPLNQLVGLGECCKLPQRGLPDPVRGKAPAENESDALENCEKATGGNHLEYSEVHVLQ